MGFLCSSWVVFFYDLVKTVFQSFELALVLMPCYICNVRAVGEAEEEEHEIEKEDEDEENEDEKEEEEEDEREEEEEEEEAFRQSWRVAEIERATSGVEAVMVRAMV